MSPPLNIQTEALGSIPPLEKKKEREGKEGKKRIGPSGNETQGSLYSDYLQDLELLL